MYINKCHIIRIFYSMKIKIYDGKQKLQNDALVLTN